MIKRTTTFLLGLLLALSSFAAGTAGNGKGMNIKITVKGLENSKMLLAYYYDDKQYLKDSFYFDKKSTIDIKADTMMPGGVYLAVFPALGNRWFEFIMSEPSFTLETDTADLVGHLKVSNSEENTLFYSDMKYLGTEKEKADSINKLMKAANDPTTKEKYRNELIGIDKGIKAHRADIMAKYPNLFYSKLLGMMRDVEVPEPPRDAQGKITDSTWQWRYYKTHYWDYVDLKDERILRSPVFRNKFRTYMNQTLVQMPDSIIAGGEELLAKTDMHNDVYRYLLINIFNDAANSKIMCYDAVYVHFGKKYFCNPDMTPWVDTAKRFKICDGVTRLEPVLCGKPAQKLILPTDSTEMQWKSLYDIKAKYTILAFWDPDCGHCKKEIPVLVEAYHNLKKKGIDVAAYCPAIMEIENYKDWLEFIQKNNLDWINVCDPKRHTNFRWEWDIQSTPQIYILDKDKIIRARRIGADQVEDYILHLENPSYRGKLSNKVNDDDTHEGAE
ncbi:MAG TPA: redoxin domain-containing protein [Chitinophagales bacterium]|nr:redoxin domain-containing protein [Chitinophagales bacterium]